MKKLFLAALFCLFLGCQSEELTEIKEMNKSFIGLWKVVEVSNDQGKTYFEPTGDLSFKINPSTIVFGDGTILFINRVLESTTKGIYFNVIVFSNNEELFAITRKKDQCMIAIFSRERIEVTRLILQWEESKFN